MARDTKIGLLVGLAFIIMVGILLSDHVTSKAEPQQAQLTQAGDNVRSGVTTPGAASNPPITAVPATTNAQATPQQQVPTKEELTPKQAPIEIVQIGGGTTPAKPATAPPAPQQESSKPTEVAQAPTEPATPPTRTSDPAVPGSLANVARTMGEELVSADGSAIKPESIARPTAIALPAGAKQYKAEPGDSVSRMASRLMGGNTKANRDALIAANPSLQQNANMVIVGRSYVIPASTTSPAPPAAAPAPVIAEATAPSAPTPIASSPEYFYTVKPGDSLTKISVTQLGSADAVMAIIDLNKDVLKGSDRIRPNMKLRLPAKPLASAQ